MAMGFARANSWDKACRVERREAAPDYAHLHGATATRSTLVRVFWALLGLAAGCAALATAGAGELAPAEIERISIASDTTYTVNAMRALFFATSATGALAYFAIWKAAHRGGLGFWRRTARPALMAACATLIGAGLTFANFFATGPVQLFGLGAAGLGAAGLLFFWILRGPPFALRPGDAYWSRALGLMFGLTSLAASVGSVGSFRHWSRQGYRFELDGPRFAVQDVVRDRWNARTRELVTEHASYRVPALSYNALPVASAMLALLAMGCFSEMRYRRRLMRLARQGAFERLF